MGQLILVLSAVNSSYLMLKTRNGVSYL